MKDYQAFLNAKLARPQFYGFDIDESVFNDIKSELGDEMFKFQKYLTRWSLSIGRSAMFEAVGLGKTIQQLAWAREVVKKTNKPVIILAWLAVAHQTIKEGKKFGIEVKASPDASFIKEPAIYITNYERLAKFDCSVFGGVVLDESSILKSFTGSTKQALIEAFAHTPYKLACSATPAPNDHMELGNHADFLGIMPSHEMLMRWFINDTMKAGGYRLKKHAAKDFWRWLTSWAVCISKPRDLGKEFDMKGYDLPPLNIKNIWVGASDETIKRAWKEGHLLASTVSSATEIHKAKRESIPLRLAATFEYLATIPSDKAVIIWCDTNYEADALIAAIPDALEVRGSHTTDQKESRLMAFTNQEARIMITKPSIAGMGLNWQHCHNVIFFSPSFSFESEYQAIGRCQRFGQINQVDVAMIVSETESNISEIVSKKRIAFEEMQKQMNAAIKEYGLFRDDKKEIISMPKAHKEEGKNWTMYLGDCIQEIKHVEDNSVHLSIFSPPFSNLYVYSDSQSDMGNAADDYEFFEHFAYLVPELYRITKPGRLVAIHCKDLPAYMNRDGFSGLRDFPGEIIRMMELFNLDTVQPPDLTGLDAVESYQAICRWQRESEKRKPETSGFRFHGRGNVWKAPEIEMQRTKNHGLLHKNFTEHAEATRQGMSDYVLFFRKWPLDPSDEGVKQRRQIGDYVGANPPKETDYNRSIEFDDEGNEITQINDSDKARRLYSIKTWQKYASPAWDDVTMPLGWADVWFDIDQTDVLNYQMAKSNEDEKHIAPLQIGLIGRCIDWLTNKGETVFSPFGGIGSEPSTAVRMGRKGIAIELKPEYFKWAVKNCTEAERAAGQRSLFDLLDEHETRLEVTGATKAIRDEKKRVDSEVRLNPFEHRDSLPYRDPNGNLHNSITGDD